jgi:hypothetical protein
MSSLTVPCALLAMAIACPAFGLSLPPSQQTAVNRSMDLMLNCEFDSAIGLCDSIAAADPLDPVSGMLKLSAMAFLDLDRNHVSDSARFFGQMAEAQRTVFAYETKNGASPYSLTVKGFTKAVAACYYLWHKSYIKGLNSGFDALGDLREAKKKDPADYDADLFLGLYNYARADMKRTFWWAFFWYPGDRESGLRSLALARKNGQFTQSVAAFVLAELAIREKKFSDAETAIAQLERDFPKSRLIRWTRAKYFEEQKLFAQAAEVYRLLADEYDTIPSAWRNSLAARWKEASLARDAGDRERAKAACDKIIIRKMDTMADSDSRQIIRDAERLMGKMKKTP